MMYRVIFEKNALEDIRSIIKSGKKSDIRKLDLMLEELKTNPYLGTGNPEQLKHQLSGFWSRRVNKKDRLIYQIFETPDQSGNYLGTGSLLLGKLELRLLDTY